MVSEGRCRSLCDGIGICNGGKNLTFSYPERFAAAVASYFSAGCFGDIVWGNIRKSVVCVVISVESRCSIWSGRLCLLPLPYCLFALQENSIRESSVLCNPDSR